MSRTFLAIIYFVFGVMPGLLCCESSRVESARARPPCHGCCDEQELPGKKPAAAHECCVAQKAEPTLTAAALAAAPIDGIDSVVVRAVAPDAAIHLPSWKESATPDFISRPPDTLQWPRGPPAQLL